MARTIGILLVFGAIHHGMAVVTLSVQPVFVQVLTASSVRADPAVVTGAMAVTIRTFRKAGIQLAYRVGDTAGATLPDAVSHPYNVVLANAPKRANHVLGAADIPQRAAWVFLDHIRSTARETGIEEAVVLGNVIAHELGHLLLESPDHAVSGVMSEPLDLSRAAQGVLGFHDYQVRRLTQRLAPPNP
jgi:hypothetical protein